jgi:hypothetical protein
MEIHMTNTHDAHLQGLTNQELDSIARQILDEAKRLECLPNDLWTAVRMTAENEDSMSLYAVGMIHSDEYPKGHDWTYTPGGQILREVEGILRDRITREWVSPSGTEKVTIHYSGHEGNYPPMIQSQPRHGIWVQFYAFDRIYWVPVQGLTPKGIVLNTKRSYIPHGNMEVTGYLMSLEKPMEVVTTIKTNPIPCTNEVYVGWGPQFKLANGRTTRPVHHRDFYTWKEYYGNRVPVEGIIRQYCEVEGKQGWEYWEVVSI